MYMQFSQSFEIEILILLLLVNIFPLLNPSIDPDVLNVTPSSVDIKIFDQIKNAMQTSIYYEIIVNGFSRDPVLVKSSLQGFEDAIKKLNNFKE